MSRRDAPAALRWSVYVAVAIVFAIVCAVLSNWQFTRNADRAEDLALVEANYDADPVALGDVLAPGAELDPSDEWTPVVMTGRYLADQQLLVRNRAHGGTAAYEVLVPFLSEDGRLLLVDRGWLPPGNEQPEPDVIPAPPEGTVEIVVRLSPGEPLPSSGRSAPDGQIPTINLAFAADLVDAEVPLETGAYGLLASEDPAAAEMPGALDAPSEDPGPHLSYAIQWILFAAMGFAFIGYVIVSERRIARESAQERAERRRRARDRDAVDEDAILDADHEAPSLDRIR